MAESGQSLGGSIAGLIGGKSADDKLVQDFLSKAQNRSLTQYSRAFRPDNLGIKDAFNNYQTLYDANSPKAQENADFYNRIAQGIFSDPTTQTSTYNDLRAGNLASLSDVYKNVLDYGLAGQKAKLAAGGYGNTGPSAYDRILSSTLTASNLSPVLQTIYGNLGRDASSAYGADRAWDAYRLGQFGSDPLTGYLDNATANRAVNPLLAHIGLLNAGVGGLAQLSPLYGQNSAGFHVEKGLSSRLNDFAAATQNAAKFATSFMGGGMGGMGGAGGAGGLDISKLMSMFGGMGGGGAPAGTTSDQFSSYAPSTNPNYFGPSASYAPAVQSYAPSNFGTSGGYAPGPMMQYQQPANYNSPSLYPGSDYQQIYGSPIT